MFRCDSCEVPMASEEAYQTHICKGDAIICSESHMRNSGWHNLQNHVKFRHPEEVDLQSQVVTGLAKRKSFRDGDQVGAGNILNHNISSNPLAVGFWDGSSDVPTLEMNTQNGNRPSVGNLLDLEDDEMSDVQTGDIVRQTKATIEGFKALLISRRFAQTPLDTKPIQTALEEKARTQRCSVSRSASISSPTGSTEKREPLCSPASPAKGVSERLSKISYRIICFQCEAGFDTIIGLQHHQMTEGHNYCDICYAYFADGSFLDKHMTVAHSFRCPTCVSTFSSPGELWSHQEDTQHGFCDVCCCYFRTESVQRKHNFMYHMRVPCPTCEQVFPTQPGLEQHQRVAQHCYCGQCDEILDSQIGFEMHVATSHAHKCNVVGCFFAGAKLNILRDHQEREGHNFCPPCNRAFTDTLALINHMKSEKHLKRVRLELDKEGKTRG
ncbi:hypothetical protein FQN49_000754 [Arthroderma sp. PD_2]|nr:hypothetical protein FQN49_000754 [Arthroderma sp. PD_2]